VVEGKGGGRKRGRERGQSETFDGREEGQGTPHFGVPGQRGRWEDSVREQAGKRWR
jgi:hypothetical protein